MKRSTVGFAVFWQNEDDGWDVPTRLNKEPNTPSGTILNACGFRESQHIFLSRAEARAAIREKHLYCQLWSQSDDDTAGMVIRKVEVVTNAR